MQLQQSVFPLLAIHGKLHGSGLSDHVSCDWLPQLELCGYRLVDLYMVKLSARISGEGTSGNQLTSAHTCSCRNNKAIGLPLKLATRKFYPLCYSCNNMRRPPCTLCPAKYSLLKWLPDLQTSEYVGRSLASFVTKFDIQVFHLHGTQLSNGGVSCSLIPAIPLFGGKKSWDSWYKARSF